MIHSHSITQLPSGMLLSSRLHHVSAYSWLRALLLLAAAILLIVLLGLFHVGATASGAAPRFETNVTPQKIAFVSHRDGNSEIYLMNPDGTNQTRLTNNPDEDTEPSISPDGNRIVFTSNRDGNDEIYIMNTEGSGLTRLTNGIYGDHAPSFSHDGKRIVFTSARSDVATGTNAPSVLNFEIYVMNVDGSNPTRLTNDPGFDDEAVFSPDDSKIAFSSLRNSSFDGNWEIYLMNGDGTNVTRLTTVIPYADQHPAFSPDGKKIAFSSSRNGWPDVYLMNVDGTNQTRLTSLPDFDDSPSFSPSGDQIVYRSVRDLNSDIFVMNTDGTGTTQLTTNSAMDSAPSWGGPALSTFQFAAPGYSVGEDCAGVTITVTRSGDLSQSATVDFATGDRDANQRTDYVAAAGTLTFAPGQATQTFALLANEDHYLEGAETFSVTLENPTAGAGTGTQGQAIVTIIDGDSMTPTTNPNDDAALFVCQHYHDFMSRQPDAGGASYWTARITDCGADPVCVHERRLDVSNAFFYEPELQDTGTYVYRIYKATFGTRPSYSRFMSDRSRVTGGAQLDQSKTDFAETFSRRPEFTAKFPTSLLPYSFVEGLNANLGSLLTTFECDVLASGLQNGTETRGSVLRKMADNQKFIDAEYNVSFVLAEYFGYLRRDPDQAGFDFWLSQVNQRPIRDVGIQHAMVCSFITSREYQERFSSVVLHSNAECPQ